MNAAGKGGMVEVLGCGHNAAMRGSLSVQPFVMTAVAVKVRATQCMGAGQNSRIRCRRPPVRLGGHDIIAQPAEFLAFGGLRGHSETFPNPDQDLEMSPNVLDHPIIPDYGNVH